MPISKVIIALFILACAQAAQAAIAISEARVWPAPEYTRITLEADTPIKHSMIMLKNPERLVVDMQDVDLGDVLKNLSQKIQANDPYIQQVRTGYFKPGVVRLVIDLRTQIKPEIFVLPPAGEYKHRLVIDVYPTVDPLVALLKQLNNPSDKTLAVPGERCHTGPHAASADTRAAGIPDRSPVYCRD